MTGHSETLSDLLWRDAELHEVRVGYESVDLHVRESNGRSRVVRCHGYIGYQCAGFWDEMVLDTGVVVDEHPFLLECLERSQAKNSVDSGSEARNARSFRLLILTFDDRTQLLVAAAGWSVQAAT